MRGQFRAEVRGASPNPSPVTVERHYNGANRVITFLGAPGSGKGTQSAMLSARFGIQCISTGEILRRESKKNTPEGKRLRSIMLAGGLVDDSTVCDAVVSRIRDLFERPAASPKTLILDGFPRNVNQAKKLDRLLKCGGPSRLLVIHLDVPRDVLKYRLGHRRQCAACGAIYSVGVNSQVRCQVDGGKLLEREDDNVEIVKRRLAAWEAETLPLVDYYRHKPGADEIYRRIDGSLAAADIANGVCDILSFDGASLAA